MKPSKLPSLALALVLQIVPVCRVATVHPAIATPAFAIVARCAAAIAALLGSVDAVSGASVPVYVAGVQSLLPSLPGVRTNITGKVGSPMVLRIILGGSVGLQPQLDFYNATALPPGLTINTNVNTNSVGLESTNYYIFGTPLEAGVWFPVTVSAGNLLYPTVAYTNILITITNAGGTSPPTITGQPQSRTVTNGGSASFTVTATGSPTYQWRKNGVSISGATAASYAIGSATTNDAGSYSVVVSNGGGSLTSSNAILSVLVPPDILTQPLSLTVTNGDAATFEVVATGLPPPSYQWRMNGLEIGGATGATLTIAAAGVANEGLYSVVVSNAAGVVESESVRLTVVTIAPPSPPILSNAVIENGLPGFDVEGPAGVDVIIEFTIDLEAWSPIYTNSTVTGTWHFLDTFTPAAGARFYRAFARP